MADSTPLLPQMSAASDNREIVFNGVTDPGSPATLYGRDYRNCTGLVFAYFGGRWSSSSIANGTVTATASNTNYVVALRSNGVVSISTSITNWNDTTNYIRLYLLTAGVSAVTSYEDHRQAFGAAAPAISTFTGGTLTSALNEAPTVTIASAATVNIGAASANTISISGTTTITAFDSIADGARRLLYFQGALILTHNATSLILPTDANITTVAGDTAEALSLGSGNWRVTSYQRKDGASLAGAGVAWGAITGTLSSQTDLNTALTTIPQNSQSTAYTAVLTDAGKHLLHPSADTTARTFTIPANSSVAFAVGTPLTFVNQASAGVMTISITTDTMRLAGAGTTGSRTLAANGIATALKITSTEWIISGTGLT